VGSIAPVVHEQLQRVFALENQSGYRFLVLELLGGMTVAEQLERERGLRVATACHWASQIARGLSALHQHDQVYGELCPDNLWLDASGAVKLVRDRFLPPVVPAPWLPDISEAQVQQANYLAPELANPGTVLNPATDLYALGCLCTSYCRGKFRLVAAISLTNCSAMPGRHHVRFRLRRSTVAWWSFWIG
jgi:serine/threonine-protein kinase